MRAVDNCSARAIVTWRHSRTGWSRWRHCWDRGGRDVAEARPRSQVGRTRPADTGSVIRDVWLLRLRALWPGLRATRTRTAISDHYSDMAKTLASKDIFAWAEACHDAARQTAPTRFPAVHNSFR